MDQEIQKIINNIQNYQSIDFTTTLINFLFCIALSFIVKKFYIQYSTSLTGKQHIGNILTTLSLVVFLVISIVKSSIALSLGLVGALSIVRFRTPIKEPEELLYLFLVIALGLGFGAYQFLITLVAFALILILVFFKEKATKKSDIQNLGIIISGESKKKS